MGRIPLPPQQRSALARGFQGPDQARRCFEDSAEILKLRNRQYKDSGIHKPMSLSDFSGVLEQVRQQAPD